MPCHCWVSDNQLEPEWKQIRDHVKEVCRLIKDLHSKGDFSKPGQPWPRDLKEDVHKLLDDLYSGKCQEGHEPVDNHFFVEWGGTARCITKDGVRNMAEVMNEEEERKRNEREKGGR